MNDMIWVWLVVLILALIIEFITVDFVTIWFALSAIPTVFVAWLAPNNYYLQIIVFFLIGFILLGFTRPLLLKYFKKNIIDTNVDAYIGKEAIVKEEITPIKNGTVLFESLIWTAIADEDIKIDTLVEIVAVEGNKLKVIKQKKENE